MNEGHDVAGVVPVYSAVGMALRHSKLRANHSESGSFQHHECEDKQQPSVVCILYDAVLTADEASRAQTCLLFTGLLFSYSISPVLDDHG